MGHSSLKVAIMGAGPGGFTAAADLSLRGFSVSLFELPRFKDNIAPIEKEKVIGLQALPSTGISGGFAKIDAVTTDIREAMSGAGVVLIMVPAFAQQEFAKLMAPFVEAGQLIVLCPGNFGGSLQVAEILREEAGEKDFIIGETECLPYACAKLQSWAPSSEVDAKSVWLQGYKHSLYYSALPARKTMEALRMLRQLYPRLEPAKNVLETGLSNVNTIEHPLIALLNATRIELREDFSFQYVGATPALNNLMEALDKEKLALGEKLELQLRSARDILINYYRHQGLKGETYSEVTGTNPIDRWDTPPEALDHRYVIEDVPFGLVPMESLSETLHTPNTVIKSIINLFSIMLGRDLRSEGRTLESLGFSHLTLAELQDLVMESGI